MMAGTGTWWMLMGVDGNAWECLAVDGKLMGVDWNLWKLLGSDGG